MLNSSQLTLLHCGSARLYNFEAKVQQTILSVISATILIGGKSTVIAEVDGAQLFKMPLIGRKAAIPVEVGGTQLTMILTGGESTVIAEVGGT